MISDQLSEFDKINTSHLQEVGYITKVADGMVSAYGLSSVKMGEIVKCKNKAKGLVMSIKEDSVDILLLDNTNIVAEGDEVQRTYQAFSVPTGKSLLGRVLNVLGEPIDNKGELNDVEYREIELDAPSIIDRQSVSNPLETGIKSIDSLIPIGKGQRELIIGDKKTGKTIIALDTIIHQHHINKRNEDESCNVYSVYVVIGQKLSSVAKLIRTLEDTGAMQHSIVVVASASDSATMQFFAPYVGCCMGEYFRDNGMHALVVYDDLTKQAIAYRQISLLLGRSPGREAYPGDIFYIHSRLLERAGQMSEAKGGGSLTALPIVETQGGDVSSYIPTNVISITDGQIFLESELFYQGIRPAINVGLSVSRVGSAAQTKAMKKVSSSIKLGLAQYREMAAFAQFGSDIDKSTKKLLNRGERLVEVLKQNQHKTYFTEEAVVVLFAIMNDYLDDVEVSDIARLEAELISYMQSQQEDLLLNIRLRKDIESVTQDKLHDALQTFLKQNVNVK